MATNDIIGDFANAMDQVRSRFHECEELISGLKTKRWQIQQRPPHADEIVASMRRGLARSAASFEQRLGWYIGSANLKKDGAAEAIRRADMQILTIGKHPPDRNQVIPGSPDLDSAAVAYFLRDLIAAELPALVAKLYPDSKNNKSAEERNQELAAIDAEIAALSQERDELHVHLAAASRAPTKAEPYRTHYDA